MRKHALVIFLLALFTLPTKSQESFHGYPLTGEGAWCWFADPRATHYTNESGTINASYIGYIDVHGNVKAMQMDYLTGRMSEVLVRSYFQPDDHNNPTFLVLPDERVLIIYSRHTDEAAFYYRVSKNKGDITILGEEKCIKTSHNTTYPSPFLMSDDPEHFYLCWRGLSWHPTIARLTLPDENDDVKIAWGPYQIVQSTGARPYAKYYSNGKDKLYLTYTTGHPDNEQPNWVYFNVINLNATEATDGTVSVNPTLEDVKGNQLSVIAQSKFQVNKTANYKNAYPYTLVDAPSDYRDWVWQIACDDEERPIIAMVRINGDKSQHQYYYAKWTGSAWRLTSLANGGGRFHSSNTEYCYSGGEAIDPENPNIIYLSIPTTGASGKSVYEIWRYTLDDDGAITAKEQVTRNSAKNNVRPFVLPGSGSSPLRLLWMNGDYYYWLVRQGYPEGYPTAIHADYEWPTSSADLDKGLIVAKDYEAQAMTATTKESLDGKATGAFTLHTQLQISESKYYGTLLNIDNLTYGLSQETVKPYVKIGETTYASSNTLYTSDNWAFHSTGTGGDQWPTPLATLTLTLTYDGNALTIYRGGLIDQVIEIEGIAAHDITIGGYEGTLHQAMLYGRALAQHEVKQLISKQTLAMLSVPDTINTDIVLPNKMNGETISWTSDHPEILTTGGLFTAPEEKTIVTLTASVQESIRTFVLTALPRNIEHNLLLHYTFETDDTYETSEGVFVRNQGEQALDLQVMGSATVDGTLNLTKNSPTAFTTNGYAIAPAQAMDGLRSYTILLTVEPSSLDKQPRLYDFGHNSGNSLFLRANAIAAGIKYNGGATTMVSSSTTLVANTTYKMAVSFDAHSHTTRIYIDGQIVGSGTSNINEPYQIAQGATCTRNYIGRTQWWDTNVANDNGDYVGTIDDFMMYNIMLTDAEIATLQGIRIEDEALNVDCSEVLVNPDFEGSFSALSGSGTTSDRAIYVPKGWNVEYTDRCKDDMTILNGSCLYASLFTKIPTTQGGGKNAYLVRQKWGWSSISIEQQCDTLPAGYYSLQADIWQSGSGGSASVWAQAGNNSQSVGAAPSNAEKWQSAKTAFACNGVEEVTFGLLAKHTANGEEQYCGFDNFKLFNITANRSEADICALLTEMIAAADEVLDGTLSEGVRHMLEEASDKANLLTEASAHADLLASYYALRDALALRDAEIDLPNNIDNNTTYTVPITYNLKGQKVNTESTKGVYIINGQKTIR